MKKHIWMLCLCMLLSGCTVSFEEEETAYINVTAETTAALEEQRPKDGARVDGSFKPLTEAEQKNTVEFLEQFEKNRVFADMTEEKALSYGGALKDAYQFLGRETEDGYGYVLAFRKGEENPLEGVSAYGNEDSITAEKWDEEEGEYQEIYRFTEISGLYSGKDHELLLMIPKDMEEPEELWKVFEYRYCSGEEGEAYLKDVMERGVRLMPPETGAYLSVSRFENGVRRYEYVELKPEEEREIIDAEEVVDPEVYGGYGIQFFVSQETYEAEEVDEGRITAPALAIAKERCRFETFGMEELHDITAVRMELDKRNVGWTEEKEPLVSEALEDEEEKKRLLQVLTSARASGDGKCPFAGVLILTRKDGAEFHVSLAADGCGLFCLGSNSFYSIENGEMEELWEMFPEAKQYTGLEPGETGGK